MGVCGWSETVCEGKFLQFVLKRCDSCSTYMYSGIKSNNPNLFFLSFFAQNYRGVEICLRFQIRFCIVKPVTYFIITLKDMHLRISGYPWRDLKTTQSVLQEKKGGGEHDLESFALNTEMIRPRQQIA